MSKALELYKAFIDGLVGRKDSMTALCVKSGGFPKTEDNKAKNDLLATLTPEQKVVANTAGINFSYRTETAAPICAVML